MSSLLPQLHSALPGPSSSPCTASKSDNASPPPAPPHQQQQQQQQQQTSSPSPDTSTAAAEKPKHRKRTRATAEQLAVLESTFAVTVSPNAKLRKQLSERLKMSERSIQIWFQNRRAKVKHMQKRAQQQQQQRASMFWRAQSVDSTFFHHASAAHQPLQQQPFAFANTNGLMMPNMRPMSMPPPPLSTSSNLLPTMAPAPPPLPAMENLYILSATTLTVGTWQRLALHVTDLMLTFAHDAFAWHIYDNGLQFKIHIPLTSVHAIEQDGNQVHLDLTEPPLFYMMTTTTNEDGEHKQRWVQCSDFSEGQQASQCLRHSIKGAAEQLKQDLLALFYAIGHLVRYHQQHDDSSDSSSSSCSSTTTASPANADPYACMYSLLPTATTTVDDCWTLQQMLPACSTTTTAITQPPFFIAQK